MQPSDQVEKEPSFPAPESAQRLLTPSSTAPVRRRAKIVLEPGHSPLDWANKKNNSSIHVLAVILIHLVVLD